MIPLPTLPFAVTSLKLSIANLSVAPPVRVVRAAGLAGAQAAVAPEVAREVVAEAAPVAPEVAAWAVAVEEP